MLTSSTKLVQILNVEVSYAVVKTMASHKIKLARQVSLAHISAIYHQES